MGALPTDTRRTKMQLLSGIAALNYLTLPDWRRPLREETESLIAEHDRLYAEVTRDAEYAREDGNLYAADVLMEHADLCYRTATVLETLLSEI